jgi:ribokinase
MFGDKAVEGYKDEGIDVSHVLRDGGRPSGVALIFVDQNGENSIAVAGGANELLTPDDVRAAQSAFASADILLMQLETPIETVEVAAKIASGNGVRIVLNPAPAQPLSDDLLGSVSILTPNESETELLTGKPVSSEADAEAAAQILSDRGVETVLITLGSKGAYVYSPDCKRLVDGFEVEAVDTTAAGDVFNGALAVAIAEGKPLEDAVVFANAAAALSVTRLGAQPSVPTRDEIVKFLKEQHQL